MFYKFLYFLIWLICIELYNASNPQVELPLGKLEGGIKKTIDGKEFFSFEGVPFGKPPVGKLRFKEPQPIEPWIGVWKANTIYKCLQYMHSYEGDENAIFGEEDCLYLNIYTPTLNTSANLDVIFYIHGGAFMFNFGGKYGPEMLLNKNIVFVTINYRLGIFGFLSTEDEVAPGNNGLRDQILALKFVKKHIQHFGGNPHSITIAGNSAGGASVHLHYLIQESRDLFKQGISMSGCALNPWVVMERPLEKAQIVASNVGCPTDSSQKLLDCLRTRNGRQLVQTVKNTLQPWLYNPFTPFGVVVDKWSKSPVLPNQPYEILQKGDLKKAPWLISHTNSEGLYPGGDFYQSNYLEVLDKNWNAFLPFILHYNETIKRSDMDQVSQKIRKFYLGDKPVNKDSYNDLIRILSDRLFNDGIEKSIRLQNKADSAVYSYYFTYRGTHSSSEIRTKSQNDFGAAHTDDLIYIVNLHMDTYSNEKDRKMSDLLVNLWTDYAKTGIPKAGSLNVPQIKTSVDNWNISFVTIKNAEEVLLDGSEDFGHRAFWDSLNFNEDFKLLLN